MTFDEDSLFEDEVRRIARARWPQAQFDGAAMVNGRERDGIFETDDVIHYVQATRSGEETGSPILQPKHPGRNTKGLPTSRRRHQGDDAKTLDRHSN